MLTMFVYTSCTECGLCKMSSYQDMQR